MRAWTSSPPMMSTFGCSRTNSVVGIIRCIMTSSGAPVLWIGAGVVEHRFRFCFRLGPCHIAAKECQHGPEESEPQALMAGTMNERRDQVERDPRIAAANAEERQRKQERPGDAVAEKQRSITGVNLAGIQLRTKTLEIGRA